MFKVINPREHVGNDIVFFRNKVDVRVNIVEPPTDAVRSGIICGNVEIVSVNVKPSSTESCTELG